MLAMMTCTMGVTARILIVEDEPDIVQVVKVYLERSGFFVEVASDGLTGLAKAAHTSPALIVLDWMLPGLDGLEFMKRLRRTHETPVIILTARNEETDRVLGLEFGADDYVTKPFSPRELVARVKAVLRRMEPLDEGANAQLRRGNLRIDPSYRRVTVADQEVELTTLEFDLLHELARQPGRVFRRDELLDRVWGRDFAGVDRVVDVHISNLRQKLDRFPKAYGQIVTVRGVGYKFQEMPS
jgi:DNA-binding response OmpR family regulator